MNSDQLKKGNALIEKIQFLEAQLFIWENATQVERVGLMSKRLPTSNGPLGLCDYNVNQKFVDFEVLKTLTTNNISKKLEEARNEFASI